MPFDDTVPPEKNPPFAPHHRPAHESGDAGGRAIAPAQLHYWKIMGTIVLVLLAVVIYLYQTKIGMPVERLESNVESQVVTQGQTANPVVDNFDNTASYDGAGVACPAGTTKVIHIDNQALCCRNNVCNETN